MRVTKETQVIDLIHELVDEGQCQLLAQTVRMLRVGKNPLVTGIDYTYPARVYVEGIASVEKRTEQSVLEEVAPKWLNRIEALRQEIAKEEGYKL